MASINSETKLKPPPVHQSPPPRRHSGGSQMDGLTNSQMNTVPTMNRDKEEEEEEEDSVIDVPKNCVEVKTNLNSLPDDIMFNILAQLPAQDIYHAVRPVCLKWYQMIHTHKFVNTHLHRSPYGLLFKNRAPQTTAQLTLMTLSRQGRIELTRLNYEPGDKIWYNSCNGLILVSKYSSPYALYITNPVTMQHFALPPLLCSSTDFSPAALAYASLSMEYKVVRVFYQDNQFYCAILTAGVDESWRHVPTQHLSHEAKGLFGYKLLTTEGFVHWAGWGNYVLTLNVETEIITEYGVPSTCSGGDDGFDCSHYYFPTAKYLSLFSQRHREMSRCGWSWEVWEMKPETGEWTKLPGIELNDRKCEILEWCDRIFGSDGDSDRGLGLVGWLEYKELLVYCVNSSPFEEPHICMVWNVRSKKIEFIELDLDQDFFTVHRNSLVWLDGCS